MTQRENGDIQVIWRCAQILRRLEPGRTVRLSPLAAELGVGRSTVHRYLSSMANSDLLERVGDGEYALGPLMAQLGTMALNSLHVVEAAAPTMRQLCDEVQETVVMSIWGGMGPVVARVQTPDKLIQVLVRVGSRLPISAAQTRLFLAFLDDQRASEQLMSLVPALRPEIEAQVTRARQEGIVIVGDYVPGLRTIAVPVFNSRGIAASLAVVGTEASIAESPDSGIATGMRRAAEGLSRQLGFTGVYPKGAS